jgi:hypothetical protein
MKKSRFTEEQIIGIVKQHEIRDEPERVQAMLRSQGLAVHDPVADRNYCAHGQTILMSDSAPLPRCCS